MEEPNNGMDFERSEISKPKNKQMKKSLFNIQKDYKELMQEIEFAEGVLEDEQIKALEINENELQSKSIAYLEVVRTKEATNTLIDNEIKRLQAMKKVNNNIMSRLNENLLQAVNTYGNYEVGLTKFGVRKSSSITVEDVNELPKEFKTIKITESANKTELKKAIKLGESIKGVCLVENLNLKIN